MSDTPRTDAEVKNTGFAKGHGFVPADFARQLERELREATKCKHPNRQGMTDGLGKFTEYCTQCHAETTALNEEQSAHFMQVMLNPKPPTPQMIEARQKMSDLAGRTRPVPMGCQHVPNTAPIESPATDGYPFPEPPTWKQS